MSQVDTAALEASDPQQRRRDIRTMAVVGLGHGSSHFSQLLLAPLFPWIKDAFALSYAELGLLMTVFFVVSGFGQAAAGFVVDRVGALPLLLGTLILFAIAAMGLALSINYPMMMFFSGLAGLANCPFHPIGFSIINARVSPQRLGRAYAVHGITGNLGWAVAPVFVVSITGLSNWRVALGCASLLLLIVWFVIWKNRELLAGVQRAPQGEPGAQHSVAGVGGSEFAFLRLPAVWLSFGFFFAAASVLGGVQSFGPESARQLHDVPLELLAMCLTAYMLSGAGGMIVGGLIASDARRAERVIAGAFGLAACVALIVGFSGLPGWTVPVLFVIMGFGTGIAGPSRDLLVRAATPPGATGRVYGMVYSGLDVGSALAPAVFGVLMDTGHPAMIWAGIALFQGAMVVSALNIGRFSGTRLAARAA